MKLYPAIDLRNGQVVRLTQGDYDKMTVYGTDPCAQARQFVAAGAKYLHVVDLDGAKDGTLSNYDTIAALAKQGGLYIEVGGGIRTLESIDEVLALGVRRVILGSVAVRDPELVKTACAKYGDRIVVGIDAKDGIVAVDGWGVSGDVEATALAKEMKKAGVKTIIYTDISRDGTLSGVNVEATAKLARESGVAIVASGGVKSIADIEALKPYEKAGIEGVIVGKSIYMGTLDLAEAIEIAAKEG